MSIKRTIIVTAAIVASVAMVAPTFAGAVTVDELMAQIAALQSQLQGLSGTSSSGTGACVGVSFTRNLTVGSTGSDVKCLQQILNSNASTRVAATGAGSPGMETTTFGQKTLAAVKVYQAANGLVPANQVGPMTRAKLNAALGGGTTPVVTPTGSISAMVASSSPAAGALVASQAQANLLDINFAGSGTVTSVTLKRSGISDQNTLTNVYLYDGVTRLTDGYAFNINGIITINGLNIAVNGSKVISVKADTAAVGVIGPSGSPSNPASSIAVALTGFNGGAAMVQGSTMSIVSGSAASASFAANTASGSSINTGTSQYSFWTAQLTIGTRAVQLKGMNLKMIGSAPTNALTNIRLFIDGVDSGKVASVGAIQGSNYAMFDLSSSPATLTTGSHSVDVRADVSTGSSRTIELSLQSATDITIYDAQVGVNVSVGTTNMPSNGPSLTIATGSSTIVIDPTFNAQTNITSSATNVTIGKFVIHGYGEDVKVNDLYVLPLIGATITAGTSAGSATLSDSTTCAYNSSGCTLTNVTLYFNGVQIGSQKTFTASVGQLDYVLGSQMIIPAGQDSTLEVKADLQTTGGLGYTAGTVGVKIVGQSSANAYGQVSQASIKFPDTSSVYTNGLSISSASLAVSKNTALASYTAAPNTSNVKIGSFTLQNQSTSEAVRLTTLTVGLYQSNGSTALTSTMLTGLAALRTSDTTGSGSTPIQPAASNVFSVSDVLQPNASMTIDIYANVGSSSLIGYVVTKLTVASIGVSSNVSSAGSAKTGQTLTFSTGTITPGSAVVTSGTTASQYVVGGSSASSQATFSFISTGGASVISELKFQVTGTDANPTQTVTNVCVGSICAQPVNGHVDIQGLSLNVPNGGSGLNQVVTASYSAVGTGGVTPNVTSTLALEYVKYTSGGTTSTLTGTTLSGSDFTSVSAPAITLVGGKPTIVVAAGGNKGMVLNQSTKVGQATITATGGAIKVRTIVFNVTWAGYSTLPTTTSAQKLTDASGNTLTDFTCTSSAVSSGAATITCTTSASYSADFPIGANQSQQFDLYVTTGGGANTGSSSATAASTLAQGTFLWDDTSDNGSNGTGLTGTLIYGFPTNSYTVSQ